MYVPDLVINSATMGGQPAGQSYVVANAADLVAFLNLVNPAWGTKLTEGPAMGWNPTTQTKNNQSGVVYQTDPVPYLQYANGAKEDALDVARIFTHNWGGSYLQLQLKYEIEGTMALYDQYLMSSDI